MRVGLDCANGSAWMIAKNVFDALGAKTYVINAEPNGPILIKTPDPAISRCCSSL